MRQNVREMKLMRTKLYGNLPRNLEYKPINYEAVEYPFGLAYQYPRKIRNPGQNRPWKVRPSVYSLGVENQSTGRPQNPKAE